MFYRSVQLITAGKSDNEFQVDVRKLDHCGIRIPSLHCCPRQTLNDYLFDSNSVTVALCTQQS